MKILFINFLLFQFANLAKAQVKQIVSEQLNKCLHKAITNPFMTLIEEELVYLSKEEIKLFTNFIYTRRYDDLRDTTLKAYFDKSDNKLSVKVKKDNNFIAATVYNLELLNAFRNADSVSIKTQESFEFMLHGTWQKGTSVVASGLLTHYKFIQSDRSFLFEKKLVDHMERLKNYSGFYSINNNAIELEVRSKTILKGGMLKHKKMPDGTIRNWYVNRKDSLINLDKVFEYYTLAISPIYTIKFDGIQKHFMKINNTIYWKTFVIED